MSELSPTPSAAYDDPDALPTQLEERLEITQKMRMKMVNILTEDGNRIPTDADSAKLVLQALNDMDRTTLGTMKQKTDDNKAASDQILARALLKLGEHQGSRSLLRSDTPVAPRVERVDDSLLPEISVVPGEMDVGTQNISYGELAGRFSRNAQQPALEHQKDS